MPPNPKVGPRADRKALGEFPRRWARDQRKPESQGWHPPNSYLCTVLLAASLLLRAHRANMLRVAATTPFSVLRFLARVITRSEMRRDCRPCHGRVITRSEMRRECGLRSEMRRECGLVNLPGLQEISQRCRPTGPTHGDLASPGLTPFLSCLCQGYSSSALKCGSGWILV